MIVSGGVNIYPQEIENLLITHPKVADVAVIGVPSADFGEEVKAVVQPLAMTDAGDALADDLTAFARRHLSAIKIPAQHRLHGSPAAPPDRQALQAPPERPLLGQPRQPDRLGRFPLPSYRPERR